MPPRVKTKKSNWGKVVNSGAGGFLYPPEHPAHYWSVQSVYGDTFGMSLSTACESEWLDDECKAAARRKLQSWEPLPVSDPQTVAWIRSVLGYFADCYQGEDGRWNASNLIHDQGKNPVREQALHAGVHWIRKYYPGWDPCADDFLKAEWGTIHA